MTLLAVADASHLRAVQRRRAPGDLLSSRRLGEIVARLGLAWQAVLHRLIGPISVARQRLRITALIGAGLFGGRKARVRKPAFRGIAVDEAALGRWERLEQTHFIAPGADQVVARAGVGRTPAPAAASRDRRLQRREQ